MGRIESEHKGAGTFAHLRIYPLGIVTTALLGLACGSEASHSSESRRYLQTEEEVLNEDLQRVADARGWTFEQAVADREAADAVGYVAQAIADFQPEMFVGSALSPKPGDAPTVYVKGKADEFVMSLVAAAKIPINVVDEQPFTFWELEERQHRVHEHIVQRGVNAASAFDIQNRGRIKTVVGERPGVSIEQLRADVPRELRSDVDIELVDESNFRNTSILGGAEAWNNNDMDCTTGFVVYEIGTNLEGVTTAGHCSGINWVSDHVLGTYVPVNFEFGHEGSWGDVQWQSDPNDSNLDDNFHTSWTNVRDVKSYEPITSISVGETVCMYGRASNSPTCAPQINNVSVSCTVDETTNNRLVRVNGNWVIGGDSGGPWFFSYGAWGTTKGWCYGDVFSAADYFDEALGVRVDAT